MQYVAIKRFKRNGIGGAFNIPYGSPIEENGGTLYYKDKAICTDHSAVMREYFARNNDGKGLERGELSQSIVDTLHIRNGETKEHHDKRWGVCWEDSLCMSYRKQAQDDFFLWDISFFNAPIEDLKYILNLVKEGEKCLS